MVLYRRRNFWPKVSGLEFDAWIRGSSGTSDEVEICGKRLVNASYSEGAKR